MARVKIPLDEVAAIIAAQPRLSLGGVAAKLNERYGKTWAAAGLRNALRIARKAGDKRFPRRPHGPRSSFK